MDLQDITQVLQSTPLFSATPETDLRAIAGSAEVVSFKLGETILRAGDEGSGFFVLQSGKVRVLRDADDGKQVTLAVLKTGAAFGERSLLFDQPVSATIRSAGKTTAIKIGRDRFLELVARNPALRESVAAALARQDLFNFLKTQRIFTTLPDKAVQSLIDRLETLTPAAGAQLVGADDPSPGFYVLRRGRMRLFVERPTRRVAAVLRPGDGFGETTLIDGSAQLFTAECAEDCEVLRLSREDFLEIAGDKAETVAALQALADNRRLQHRAFAEASDAGEAFDDDGRPPLREGVLRPKGGWFSLPVSQCADAAQAGVCCLRMAARQFRLPDEAFAALEPRADAEPPTSLIPIARQAEGAGLMTRLVTLPDAEADRLMCPAVVFRRGTPVVLYKLDAKGAVIADPLHGLARISRQAFLDSWDGEALIVQNAPDFGAIGANVFSLPKQFLPLLKPFAGVIMRILGITLLLQAFGLIPPFFTQILIDNVLVVGDKDLLVLLLVGMVLATFIGLVADALREFLMLHLTRRVSGVMFTRFFGHIMSMPMAALRRWDTGSLTARFEENEKILDMASSGALSIIVNSLAILIYTPILFVMEPRLALVALVFILGIVATIIYCAPKLRAFDERSFEIGAAQESHLIEVVKGVATVKAMAQEESFIERGRGFFRRALFIERESERFDQKMEFVTDFLQQGSNVAVLGIGATFVLDGSLSPGQLIAFTAIVASVMGPAEALANFYDEFLEFRVALDRLNDILREPRETSGGAVAECPPLKGRIRFEHVRFSYEGADGTPVLDGVDLEIKAGQKVAFVGRSGSGKSTLVNLVNRMASPTGGRVLIDGLDVAKLDLRSLRQQIGVVEQDPFVFSGTIRENIAKADPKLPLDRVMAAARLAGAADFIEALPMGYDTRVGEGGRSLSGGQAQRLIIARALSADPAILILDEATSALDSESERAIQKRLDQVMEGRTTLVVAHRLSTIRNADLIVVLSDGKIAETGAHDDLVAAGGLYSYMVNQSGG
ncbi:MAG: peptidase domain-containing ABC transporter [Marivibrio sp.]|uniref:peptidase domain-containing ABC transporter n=1 Tax=Marivibrio sp. TaxID=2039719 RepID=UPI0032EB8D44